MRQNIFKELSGNLYKLPTDNIFPFHPQMSSTHTRRSICVARASGAVWFVPAPSSDTGTWLGPRWSSAAGAPAAAAWRWRTPPPDEQTGGQVDFHSPLHFWYSALRDMWLCCSRTFTVSIYSRFVARTQSGAFGHGAALWKQLGVKWLSRGCEENLYFMVFSPTDSFQSTPCFLPLNTSRSKSGSPKPAPWIN